ncbi:MAG: HD domain-containing phosphohydrolase [Thermodesulfobacteriota bacterium]
MNRSFTELTPLRVLRSIPLSYDIPDLEGEVLIRRGKSFSNRLLKNIARRAGPSGKTVLLRDHPLFGKDLLHAIKEIPFYSLLMHHSPANPFEKVSNKASLPSWGIQALEYFKRQDPDTYWHCLRVFALTAYMALHFIQQQRRKVLVASMGPLHDVGKIAVPLSVLQKRTPLTREERDQLRHHVLAGAVLHSYYQYPENSLGAKVALEHHERLDGSGYPFGLRLKDPMVELIALCDVYDALISPRPYRNRAYDLRTCLEVLTDMAINGTFSLNLVRFLISLHRREKTDYRKLILPKEKRGQPPEENYYGQVLAEK